MIVEGLERGVMNLPVIGRLYRKNAAGLKRRFCLILNRFGMLKPYTFVQWLATNRCNLTCPFCETASGEAGPGELSMEETQGLVDDLSSMGVKRLLISGGEPLMRRDIGEIMAYANRRNLLLGLATNGWFVQEMENVLRDLRFFLYFTSIDGMPEYHDKSRGRAYAFSLAMGGLDLFARMGVPVRIVNTAVHPGNIPQLEGMVEIIRNSAATSWRLSPVSNVGRAECSGGYDLNGEHLRYLADFIRRNGKSVNLEFGEAHAYLGCFTGDAVGKPFFCGAGLTRCSIMPDGEVVGCHQIFDRSFSEGNIREKNFSRIWKEGFSRFRGNAPPGACLGCAYLRSCRGGCWTEMAKRGSCLKSVWHDGNQAQP
jgi:radical SAM protein with 4Fe4S-binding SPASM domain